MKSVELSTLYDKITKYDFSVVFISIIISIIGLFNIYSATNTASFTGTQGLFGHQIIFVCAGLVFMGFFIIIDYRRLGKAIYIAYAINVLLLVAVLVLGRSALGARRWLSLGFLSLQPSEFMKITLVLTLARYFSNDINLEGYSLRDLLVPTIMAAVPAGLIIIEPDLGSGLLLMLVAFSIFLFVKIQWRSLLILGIVGAISLPIVYNVVLKDYQRKRVITFIDPTLDPKGAGYNSLQSRIAVGSGQLVGKGYMKGTQTQLNFLPEHHTDFIFSVLAEEHGFLGSIFLAILYVLLFISGVRISSRAGERLGVLIAMGCTAVIFWHAFVNMGMVLGIMPIVGVTLPFMSYGGTSVIVNFVLIGIIQGISIRRFMF
ncbi:MAG: rod shape-determining protein RodA [bacterium]